MTILTKAAAVAAGLALVSITAASANNHAEGAPTVQLVAQLGARSTALDASPDPAGKVIYYTTGGERPAIFSVPAAGGAQHKILSGGLLRRPAGKAAVLRIRTTGATRPTIVAKGGPLRDPDGVAIATTGAIFVTDHGLGGRALKIAGSKITTVAGSIRLGDPAGVALTLDETHLLVSSLNKATATAQVVIVDLATGATSTFDDVIGANHSAGGLHRARAAVPMGWADVQRPGRIYRVDP